MKKTKKSVTEAVRDVRGFLREVESLVESHQGPARFRDFIARYVGGVKHEKRKPDEQSRLKFHGMQIPRLREIYKMGEARIAQGAQNLTAFGLWNYVFTQSQAYEAKSMAMMYLRDQSLDLYRAHWPQIRKWVDHVDNWAHSDELSHIYAKLLEDNIKQFKPYFETWNRSQNPWHRRQSVVGLMNYSRPRKKYPPLPWMLKLIENLLDDEHVYVQKGVGWALREIHNIAPERQEAFVKKHLTRISPTAWYAATENYSTKEKTRLVLLRKAARAQARKSKARK